MSLLNEEIQEQVRQAFSAMTKPVKVLFFSQGQGGALECDYCAETHQLLEELAALSDKIELEVYDFLADEAVAQQYGVDKIPAIVLLGGEPLKDYGIRFYGIPSGYEFGTLIEDLLMLSQGEHNLLPKTLEALQQIDQPVHIQVFVTPTCPYCPRAVLLAHKLAMASDHIRSDMVEAIEFPHLANKYQVYGVPRTVINEVIHIEGAVPESALIQRMMAGLKKA